MNTYNKLAQALRKLVSGWQWAANNAATNGDNSGSALLRICAKEAENLLSAHDARESSPSGSTDSARGNDGPNVPDRDAVAWIVIDDEGRSHYASSFPEACHDHINEALMHEDDDAKAWHVIPVYRMPAAQRAESELAALKDENARLLAANKDCILHYEDCRSELAALRKRIAEAPTHVAEWTLAYGLTFNDADGTLDGHRVALLDVGKEG